jgi:hypothetical protein
VRNPDDRRPRLRRQRHPHHEQSHDPNTHEL